MKIEALRYRYPGQSEIAFADFSLSEGEPWLLLGQSGSGKTTLLHLIGGLLRSQQGQIIIKDTNISGLSETALDRFRGQHMGFVFQRNHLISALSVRQNLLMAPYLAGVRQDAQRVEAVLEQLGISDKADVNVKELSYGQAQRVAIARALLNRPTVILADEPTSALDDTNCDKVMDLLLDASKLNNTTLVVATHDHRLKHKIPHQINLAQA